ncbi:MAG: helix-turn-helix domain-containing protein [Sphingobacteriales bacterium]
MFVLEYNYNDYEQLLNDIGKKLGLEVKNCTLNLPENVGTGYLRCVKLPNGLQVNIINAGLNQDWLSHRTQSKEEYYTLRFDELEIPTEMTLAIDKNEISASKTVKGVAYLTSSLFDWYYIASNGVKLKGINILFSKEWVAKYLGLKNADDVLTTYLSLKAENFDTDALDEEYKAMIEEIMLDKGQGAFPLLTLQNRLLALIERFFSRLYDRSAGKTFSLKISNYEMQQLKHVEALLLKSFSGPPPSIPQLAKEAAMSPTKLKKLFKAVYGNAIHEYFQKKRMQHAADLLLSRKYSVKEIGSGLGYANLSNFTLAFKKEFNRLPSEF